MTQAERIEKMAVQVNEMHGDFKVLRNRVESHERTLYGNGKPGLVAEFQSVKEAQASCPALQEKLLAPDTKADRKANRLAVWSLVIFGLLNLCALAVALAALFAG